MPREPRRSFPLLALSSVAVLVGCYVGIFSWVSAGGDHTCGMKTDGSIACWGDNTYGQATPSMETLASVSAGGYHTCGLRNNGTVSCWGGNGFGQAQTP
ncbi:MAG TPA: RCC1 domain-containing protein [Polyangia bacterium]|nr:RCC1 domain-containing protein [Polyangia bacterium]